MRNHTFCIVAMLGMAFHLILSFSAAHAQAVPDPVLYFDPVETEQRENDKFWRNAGTAGGQLQKTGAPRLEEGAIEIKGIGFKQETKWYTTRASGSTFSNDGPGDVPVVNLEDFTMGLLLRINGGLIAQEHHLVGLQATPRESVQNVRIWLDENGGGFGNISIAQGAIGARADLRVGQTLMSFDQGKWHWTHLVFKSGKTLTGYINGEQVSESRIDVKWNKKHDMNLHAIFAHSRPEAVRTCNCSISIYRVYDRALSAAEIGKNVRRSFAVDPAGKLATTWGKLKRGS
ncbi:MAG: hypothetical protein OXN17_07605 [Candidatus Poribacteria bacterium]|nr:hypothetical protein [Candidatus Poribacteria bacterium]MDE0504221.1 hypothetical protein [Candidatus Poribacteria bacterium]